MMKGTFNPPKSYKALVSYLIDNRHMRQEKGTQLQKQAKSVKMKKTQWQSH